LRALRPYLIVLGWLGVRLTIPAAAGDLVRLHEYTQVHMGLPVRVAVYTASEGAAHDAARAAFDRIAALDRTMSDYRPDSELRRLTSGAWIAVSPELFRTIARAVEIAAATDGAFDPSVGPLVALWREARNTGRLPDHAALNAARARVGWRKIRLDTKRRSIRLDAPGMQLDLGGIAKGYILQEALREIRARGLSQALLEAGGDIVVGEAPPGRRGWRIETPGADPVLADRASRLTNAAIATSGATAQFVEIAGVRYSHVIDPRTGLGVTTGFLARVIDDDAATADALATAFSVLGPSAIPRLRARFPRIIASVTNLAALRGQESGIREQGCVSKNRKPRRD
jgi:FAD:protein FMN transferase